jgi:short-subunit dehydrogenase
VNTSALQLSGSGDASWAIVTGGSDGLGLAMAKKLAREGFNICIVSRTEKKINEKLDEVRNECR